MQEPIVGMYGLAVILVHFLAIERMVSPISRPQIVFNGDLFHGFQRIRLEVGYADLKDLSEKPLRGPSLCKITPDQIRTSGRYNLSPFEMHAMD
jgi:hypothetical protein